jgi:hypothetical protein
MRFTQMNKTNAKLTKYLKKPFQATSIGAGSFSAFTQVENKHIDCLDSHSEQFERTPSELILEYHNSSTECSKDDSTVTIPKRVKLVVLGKRNREQDGEREEDFDEKDEETCNEDIELKNDA